MVDTTNGDGRLRFQRDAVLGLKSGDGMLITGEAGTGKSTLIGEWLRLHGERAMRLAPTGVAALNFGGQTIHRAMHISPGASNGRVVASAKNLLRRDPSTWANLDTVVVDEIGMVRSDLLSQLDLFLRAVKGDPSVFGGVRMIFVGDPLQLQPVVGRGEADQFGPGGLWHSPWFFDSPAFRELARSGDIRFVNLKRPHRQSDTGFLDLLHGIRLGEPDGGLLADFNDRRADGVFAPDAMTLTPVNSIADERNARGLAALDADRFTVCADVSGKWPTGTASDPVRRELTLCVGARVMTVANDPDGAYVNGSTGTLLEWTPNPGVALVRLDNGPEVEVRWHRWSQVERVWDDRRDRMVNRSVGEFVQLPLKLAYASTIHKAQGLTLDGMNLAIRNTQIFAEGQAYVALSRCRTAVGIHMDRRIAPFECKASERVLGFLKEVGCL